MDVGRAQDAGGVEHAEQPGRPQRQPASHGSAKGRSRRRCSATSPSCRHPALVEEVGEGDDQRRRGPPGEHAAGLAVDGRGVGAGSCPAGTGTAPRPGCGRGRSPAAASAGSGAAPPCRAAPGADSGPAASPRPGRPAGSARPTTARRAAEPVRLVVDAPRSGPGPAVAGRTGNPQHEVEAARQVSPQRVGQRRVGQPLGVPGQRISRPGGGGAAARPPPPRTRRPVGSSPPASGNSKCSSLSRSAGPKSRSARPPASGPSGVSTAACSAATRAASSLNTGGRRFPARATSAVSAAVEVGSGEVDPLQHPVHERPHVGAAGHVAPSSDATSRSESSRGIGGGGQLDRAWRSPRGSSVVPSAPVRWPHAPRGRRR